MRLETLLNTAKNLAEIDNTIPLNYRVRLSFWGDRYISVCGLEGEITIDNLAIKIMKYVNENPHFNENERKAGLSLVEKVNRAYETSDILTKKSNFFTRLLSCYKSTCYAPWHNPSFEEHAQGLWKRYFGKFYGVFNLCTAEQHRQLFGIGPIDFKHHYNLINGIPYWDIPDQQSMARAVKSHIDEWGFIQEDIDLLEKTKEEEFYATLEALATKCYVNTHQPYRAYTNEHLFDYDLIFGDCYAIFGKVSPQV